MRTLLFFLCAFLASAACQCDNSTNIESLVSTPLRDLDDAASRLTCLLSVFIDSKDFRGVFLGVYVDVTFAVIEKIEDGNYFFNNTWVGQYLVNFADLYRQRVLQQITDSPSLPCTWRQAFEPDRNITLIFQDLLLGMNAHIDYDLAIAISKTGMRPNRRQKFKDHTLVNQVLESVYSTALTDLVKNYEPAVGNITKKLFPLISLAFDILLPLTRQAAWDNASMLSLASHRGGRLLYNLYLKGIDTEATLIGSTIQTLHIDQGLFAAMKLLEGDDPMFQFCCWMPSYCQSQVA